MKKSELIKIFVDSYELHSGNDPAWLDRPDMINQKQMAYEVASKVIDDLLVAGMFPPLYERNNWQLTMFEPED